MKENVAALLHSAELLISFYNKRTELIDRQEYGWWPGGSSAKQRRGGTSEEQFLSRKVFNVVAKSILCIKPH